MTETSLGSHRTGCRDRLLSGTPIALVLTIMLAACQGAGPPDSHSSDQLMRVADDTRAGGDLGTAVDLYRHAAESNPSDPRPLAGLAATLSQLHAYTEAAETYRTALRIQPNSVEGELRRGLAMTLLSLNQPEAALSELDKAIASAPGDAKLYNTLGVAHDLMGRHELAQQDYRKGMHLAPRSSNLRNNYGLSLALSGDYGAAATTLSELADEVRASPRHRLNLALVYGLAGDDKKAAYIAGTTLDEAAVKSNLAYYAMLRGMDDKARANAIMGGQVRGPASVAEPPPARVAGEESTAAAEPAPPIPMKSADPAPSSKVASPAPAPSESVAGPAATAGEAPQDAATNPPTKLTKAEPAMPEPSPAAEATPAPAATEAATEQTAAAEPSQESTPAAESTDAKPSPKPSHKHSSKHASAAVAAAKTEASTGFAVQAGAFANEANAHKLADRLNQKGYEMAVVHHKDREGRDWFTVRAGGYGSADEAEAAARHMREADQVPAVVVHQRKSRQA